MNRRHLLFVALVAVGLSSVTGVGSVSSVSADRDISVAVADDSEAYLGIEFGAVENGTATLTVTNRISTEALDVTVEDGDTTELQTLGPGEFAAFDVACGEEAHVSAVGPTTEIDATRSVACEHSGDGDSSDGPTNNGQCSNSGVHGKSGESGHCGRDSNEGDRGENHGDGNGDEDDRWRDRDEQGDPEDHNHDEDGDRSEHERDENGDQNDRDGDDGDDH
ncbi:hypothetical protein C2R22_20685 [Salinigranum rubrum]|uniref:Uncharacterized protein n=1 Tax=Salinigranum rubrum TaxID=755307 RepID=A0A2I8VPE0_9EURY|nr:hypothetical protein [Salinigranum rubrum]AUV83765.1 hypothetical protein C2R22_20685 [Salinigranum rubrum]